MFGLGAKNKHWAQNERIYLRCPLKSDGKEWIALRTQSSQFLQPREPRWDDDHLSMPWFGRYLRRINKNMQQDQSLNMLIFLQQSNILVGAINAANVRYGPFCCADIGYWIGVRYARQGIMSQALGLFLPGCFETLRLKRLQALCLADNIASQRVLLQHRFQYEGAIRRAMCINGHWQDHNIYGRINTD